MELAFLNVPATLVKGRQARGVRTMARYKMTVVLDVHEEVKMKHVHEEAIDGDKVTLANEAVKGNENTAVLRKKQPHINKLYEDVIERIETSLKHPITYNIVSFEKLKEE
jgi:hypothetical protein